MLTKSLTMKETSAWARGFVAFVGGAEHDGDDGGNDDEIRRAC